MENINLELYKIFYYVAKNKNITKASQELLISQPAITQTIKKLEEQIGNSLFYRTKQGMRLTKNGELLYNRIKLPIEILITSKQAIISSNSDDLKTIRIGGGTTLLKHNLTKPLKEFIKENPNIKIDIVHEITEKLLEMIDDDLLDIALCKKPSSSYENVAIIPIEHANYIFAAETNIFKKYNNEIIKKEELENLPFVIQTNIASTRKILDSICKKNKINLNNCYEMASYSLVLDFVKAGLGIGFVNRNHILKELEKKELYELNTNMSLPIIDICIAINKKNIHNKTIIKLITLLKK